MKKDQFTKNKAVFLTKTTSNSSISYTITINVIMLRKNWKLVCILQKIELYISTGSPKLKVSTMRNE